MPTKIVSVAITWRGMIFSMPKPHRHHHVLLLMREMGLPIESVGQQNQGFLTDEGLFVDRVDGHKIAAEAGQVNKPELNYMLISEMLW